MLPFRWGEDALIITEFELSETMKLLKLIAIAAASVGAMAFSSCCLQGQDDPPPPPYQDLDPVK